MRTVAFVLWVVGFVALVFARVDRKNRARAPSVLFRHVPEDSAGPLPADVAPSGTRPFFRTLRRSLPQAIALLALALSAIVFFADWSRTPPHVSARRSLEGTVRQITSERGVESQPSLSPGAGAVAYRAEIDGTGDILVRDLDGGDVINLTSHLAADESDPAFSPDGRLVAFRSTHGNGGIFVIDREGGAARRLSNFGASPAWTPDGAFIIFATRSSMDPRAWSGPSEGWIVNVQSGEMSRLIRQDFREPAVSPNGRHIAYSSSVQQRSGTRRASVIRTVGIDGRNPRLVSGGFSIDWNPVWSPDGAFLYFLSDHGGGTSILRVSIDPNTGRSQGEPARLQVRSDNAAHLTIAHDGRHLAWSTVEWSPALFRVDFDADTRSIRGNPRAVSAGNTPWKCAEASPDGSTIAFVSEDSTRDVQLLRVDSGEVRSVTDDAAIEGCPRWSPDGRRIAFHSDAGGSNRLWLADADGSSLHLAGPALGELTNPVWAPDNLSLVAWDRRATGLRLVRLPEGRRASSENLASPPHPFTPVDWSPDGTQIAGTAAGNLWVYIVASRTYEPLVPGTAPAWLATSRRLLFASEGRLMMLDLPSRYTREILALPDLHLDSPILSPDDRHLYFNQNATEANLWLLTLK